MGLISPEIIESIRENTDIVALIGEYIRLQKRGRNYVGNCPFHQEKEPSFTVTPDKQIFYCFGCQTGGNVFKFLMLHEKLTFQESVQRLAQRIGVFIPDTDNWQDKKGLSRKDWAWKANKLVADYYHYILVNKNEALKAREYLKNRGLSDNIITFFKLGYAPNSWDSLLDFMKRKGFNTSDLLELGLAGESQRGKIFDRFRDRVIFPVTDAQDRIVGFGGRVLDDGQPKYLNSPETPFFEKSNLLFGLSKAKPKIREKEQVVLMEGYMDVITAHQYGISNAVASLGTSFTPKQGNLLLRYTKNVLLAFDADKAGILATIRCLDILQEVGLSPKVLNFTLGKDPDEFIRSYGVKAWEDLVIRAIPLLDYKLDYLLANGKSRLEALEGILSNLALISDMVQLEEGIKVVSSRLTLSWDAVKEKLYQYKKNNYSKWKKTDINIKNTHTSNKGNISPALKAEKELLQVLLEDSNWLNLILKELGKDFCIDPLHQQIYNELVKFKKIDKSNLTQFLEQLTEPAVNLVSEFLVKDSIINPKKVIKDCVAVIKREIISNRRAQLLQDLAKAEDNNDLEKMNLLMQQIQNLR